MVALILQKSAKSLQVKLNEFAEYLEGEAATASAFTQARANLLHTIFIELNKGAYAEVYYEEEDYETYKGHRLFGIDGSKIRLPDEEEIREEFGVVRLKNQHSEGKYTGGLCSVFYDILNQNAVDSILAPGTESEITLAKKHLEFCQEGDLILLDRNYPGYELFAEIRAREAHFVVRCSSNAFSVVENFIAQEDLKDTIVTLTPCKNHLSKVKQGLLPVEMKIRLIKVELCTGEIEILASSLLDQKKYVTSDFYELYGMRWGIETFYDRLKNRLFLENFTGRTSESVKQDFYASVLLANIESELTSDIDQELCRNNSNNNDSYARKVNKTISYNAIKEKAFDLLFSNDLDLEPLKEQLLALFKRNTIPIRPNRSSPRKTTARRALNFHIRKKKFVF